MVGTKIPLHRRPLRPAAIFRYSPNRSARVFAAEGRVAGWSKVRKFRTITPETDAVIDHGEAAARELGRADQRAADIFAGLGGGERQSAFGSHGLSDTSHLRTLQIGDKIL